MTPLALLFKLKWLSKARESTFARLLFGRNVSVNQALFLKICGFFLVPLILLSFMLLSPGSGWTGEFDGMIRGFIQYRHVILNGLWIFTFFYGLLAGSDLIHDLTVSDNYRYLSLPLATKDLVLFRMIGTLGGFAKFFLYFLLPLYFMIFCHLGAPFYRVAVYLVTILFIYMTAFLSGQLVLLLSARLSPGTPPEKIFVPVFLATTWTFLIAFKLSKILAAGSILHKTIAALDFLFSKLFLTEVLETALAANALPLTSYLPVIVCVIPATYFFCRLFYKSLLGAYNHIHVKPLYPVKKSSRKRKITGLKKIYTSLKFIPANLRIMLAKDLALLLRRPYFLLKMLFFVFVVAGFFMYYQGRIITSPRLLFMYLFPALTGFRLFAHAVGLERSNILLIKQLAPSPLAFLKNRMKVNLIVTVAVVIPVWLLFVWINPGIMSTNMIFRLILLSANLVTGIVLLTGYSAAFAVFEDTIPGERAFGIAPAAVLPYMFLGLCVPVFFYLVDMYIVAAAARHLLLVPVILSGVIAFVSIVIFTYLGTRKIANHS